MSQFKDDKQTSRYILWGVLGILALIVFFSSFYTIRSTERGVLSTFGKMSDQVVGDGLHLKVPFIQTIKKVNIQQKKFDGRENSYTRDVQTSEVEYTINYDLVRENVTKLMKNVGDDYHNRIVVPFIRSAMKEAFGNFADIASSDFAVKNGVAAADSTLSQVRFFQGYSEYQIQKFAEAYDSFSKARKLGYTENNIVDFQTSALANMVQSMLDKNEYDKANAFIDNALSNDPMNGTLHDIKGFTTELMSGIDAALPFYIKATEVDPNYPNAFFDVGRCLYLQAQKIIDDNPTATNKDLVPKIKPIYDRAIPFLQKAIDLNTNPDDTKAKKVLDDILYKFEVLGVN